ncbi:LysR family transcriptional regulator [Jannaschia sp. Os4]|uniref:LysR family transcriptional regulator n=1 Tax=Jannaschia sp. Os4 TaxID=2807617 RepID=UPI00193ACAE4|nr:LysR family transcriptional regulator [Jannaschia sp. Os4]MBM2576137.1 LysR family transcriptional regulator [Jannaschia sp. Os4]
MADLNYKHLRYFRAVARAASLTEAAGRLNLSQSALSSQIRTLEARLGVDLFERRGRGLHLTEAGRIALAHADRAFAAGDDLLAVLGGRGSETAPLRVGAEATLSRNFQARFLAPVLGGAAPVVLRSGTAEALAAGLATLELDVALVTEPPHGAEVLAHLLAEQAVGLHGRAEMLGAPDLRALLAEGRFVVPSGLRAAFLGLGDRLGVAPRLAAEADDMAMVRLLAREGAGIAVAPAVVVADELAAGRLATAPFETGLAERFHALTVARAHPHPAVARLLGAARDAPSTPPRPAATSGLPGAGGGG